MNQTTNHHSIFNDNGMSHRRPSSLSSTHQINDGEISDRPTTSSDISCGSIGSVISIKSTRQSAIDIDMSPHLLNGMTPVESSSSDLTPATDSDTFLPVMIESDLWINRIQDKGCAKDVMPANTYRRSQIPGIGPKGHETYYYDLTSTAIDIFFK